MKHMAYIAGSGLAVPKKKVSNIELSKTLDTSDEWIRTRTGIEYRHIAQPDETCSDLALQASLMALQNASLQAKDLDAIIVCTATPDHRLPATACLVQQKLNATKACAFDIHNACSGTIYALSIAKAWIENGTYHNILIVGSEVLSRILNWNDRNTCVLFGDGAGAVIAQKNTTGFLDINLGSDGNLYETLWIPDEKQVQMQGKETYKYAVQTLTKSILSILKNNHLSSQEIQHVIAHQANLRILETVAEKVQIPMTRFPITLDQYANTSSASLLMSYHQGFIEKRYQKGEKALFLAIGAGFAYGVGLYEF